MNKTLTILALCLIPSFAMANDDLAIQGAGPLEYTGPLQGLGPLEAAQPLQSAGPLESAQPFQSAGPLQNIGPLNLANVPQSVPPIQSGEIPVTNAFIAPQMSYVETPVTNFTFGEYISSLQPSLPIEPNLPQAPSTVSTQQSTSTSIVYTSTPISLVLSPTVYNPTAQSSMSPN